MTDANLTCVWHLQSTDSRQRKIFREILHSLGSHRHGISLSGAANKAVYTREDFTGD